MSWGSEGMVHAQQMAPSVLSCLLARPSARLWGLCLEPPSPFTATQKGSQCCKEAESTTVLV